MTEKTTERIPAQILNDWARIAFTNPTKSQALAFIAEQVTTYLLSQSIASLERGGRLQDAPETWSEVYEKAFALVLEKYIQPGSPPIPDRKPRLHIHTLIHLYHALEYHWLEVHSDAGKVDPTAIEEELREYDNAKAYLASLFTDAPVIMKGSMIMKHYDQKADQFFTAVLNMTSPPEENPTPLKKPPSRMQRFFSLFTGK